MKVDARMAVSIKWTIKCNDEKQQSMRSKRNRFFTAGSTATQRQQYDDMIHEIEAMTPISQQTEEHNTNSTGSHYRAMNYKK